MNALWTFSVHNRLAALFILLFRDPHLMEGAERAENGSTDPRAEASLSHCRRCGYFRLVVLSFPENI